MNTHARWIAPLLGLALIGGVATAVERVGSYELLPGGTDGTTAVLAGGDYSMVATAGQPDGGAALTGGEYTMSGGIWEAPPEPPDCPTDLDGDGRVGLADLTDMLNVWGFCPGDDPCPADLNDDGRVGLEDLTNLLNTWGFCP